MRAERVFDSKSRSAISSIIDPVDEIEFGGQRAKSVSKPGRCGQVFNGLV